MNRRAWPGSSLCARDQRNGQGAVVAQASCNYRRPIPYPETVRVNLYVGAPRCSSFTTYYDLFSASDESIKYGDGQAVMVWVDRASGKSLPMADYRRSVLAPSRISSSPPR